MRTAAILAVSCVSGVALCGVCAYLLLVFGPDLNELGF